MKPEVYPNNFRNSLPHRKQSTYALHGLNGFEYKDVIIHIVTIIIILVITFIQGIYIPETNHVSRVNSFAAVLYLQFVLHVTLFRL
jgi:uncharacterized Tic20 family protein